MISKTKLGKDTLVSTIMTLITVMVWIGFEVYRTLTQSTIPKVTQEQLKPLEPKIKREIIEEIKTNLSLSDQELNAIPELETSSLSTASAIANEAESILP